MYGFEVFFFFNLEINDLVYNIQSLYVCIFVLFVFMWPEFRRPTNLADFVCQEEGTVIIDLILAAIAVPAVAICGVGTVSAREWDFFKDWENEDEMIMVFLP